MSLETLAFAHERFRAFNMAGIASENPLMNVLPIDGGERQLQ
jgi:hypothetical protein